MNSVSVVSTARMDKKMRVIYTIEAMLEYFVALSVSNTYLPKLCDIIGVSDTFKPIIVGIGTIGSSMQLLTLLVYDKAPFKIWITIAQTIAHLFYASLWFVPSLRTPETVKIILFVTCVLFATALQNVVYAPKAAWMMTFVDEDKRGKFTSVKEIVSLIGGILFTLAFGKVADGNTEQAFALCGLISLSSGLLHTISLAVSHEKPYRKVPHEKGIVGRLVGNKAFLKVQLLGIMWYATIDSFIPLFATYQYATYGLSMSTFVVSIITASSSLVRALLSQPLGRLADKTSFSKMLNVCFFIEIGALCSAAIAFPVSEWYSVATCAGFWVLYHAGYAGINSVFFNIMFDYVEPKERTAAIALSCAARGLGAFAATFAVSMLASFIRSAGLTVGGLKIDGIHIFALVAILMTVCTMLYNRNVIRKLKRAKYSAFDQESETDADEKPQYVRSEADSDASGDYDNATGKEPINESGSGQKTAP